MRFQISVLSLIDLAITSPQSRLTSTIYIATRHFRGRPDAEEAQYGYRKILEARIRNSRLAGAEQDPWHRFCRNAVVADPGIGIVFEHRRRCLAQRRFPRDSVARG